MCLYIRVHSFNAKQVRHLSTPDLVFSLVALKQLQQTGLLSFSRSLSLVKSRSSNRLLELACSFLSLLNHLALAIALVVSALVETNSSNREEDDNSNESPGCLLEEVGGFWSAHYLVATGETSCQTTALRVLYKNEKHYEDRCYYDKDSKKIIHIICVI